MFKAIKLTAAVALIGISATSVQAADWIDSVKLSQGIIKPAPVEVTASSNGYTAIKTQQTSINFSLHATAKKGKRIAAMRLGSYKGVYYFEYAGDLWHQDYEGRDTGSGSKATVNLDKTINVPTTKINWYVNPVQLCQKNLENQMKKGLHKSEVLAKSWSMDAAAYFELDAVAARKKDAESGKITLKNTTSQRSGAPFTIPVKCNSTLKKAP
ncbi:hypothetical protein [Roseibium suaedae]|uniref:DUF3108 domain-containing protein n=1 Tax=Roseibium suaedae TaxID=735517 RepID=A0A1M7AK43_9HYPH|nr:hypothetical protein [Roseibium suaedae]SHL42866.1 hypothetical protein SAMN05444272_0565 [Roseibium suaedae]